MQKLVQQQPYPQITTDNSGEFFGQLPLACLFEVFNCVSWADIIKLSVVNIGFYTTIYTTNWLYCNPMHLTDIDTLVIHGGQYLHRKCRAITHIIIDGNDRVESETLKCLKEFKKIYKVTISDNVITPKGQKQAAVVIDELLQNNSLLEFEFNCNVLMNTYRLRNYFNCCIRSAIIKLLNTSYLEKLCMLVSGPNGCKTADECLDVLNLRQVKQLHLTIEDASTIFLKKIQKGVDTRLYVTICGQVLLPDALQQMDDVEYLVHKMKPLVKKDDHIVNMGNGLEEVEDIVMQVEDIEKIHEIRLLWQLIMPFGANSQLKELEKRVTSISKTRTYVHVRTE